MPATGGAMLVVIGGLPGTGKTTISRRLARRCGAVYLRIDAIEVALQTQGFVVGAAGYAVAQALASANLQLGSLVLVDAVNPVAESRAAWRALAEQAQAPLLEVELVCSDAREHQRRVTARAPDLPGQTVPDWSAVLAHRYEPWTGDRLVIDTAATTADAAVRQIEADIAKKRLALTHQ